MDDTDLLLQEILRAGTIDRDLPKPKTAEEQLAEVRALIERLIAYRAARKTVIRNDDGFAVSIVIEGFGIIKLHRDNNGLIKSLDGMRLIHEV